MNKMRALGIWEFSNLLEFLNQMFRDPH
jgi:hypothetical protein